MVFHHYLECLIDWEQNRGTEVNWQVLSELVAQHHRWQQEKLIAEG